MKNWLNSINKIIAQDIRELKNKNSILRKHSYSLIKSWFIKTASKPFRNSFEVFILISLLSLLSYVLNLYPDYYPWAHITSLFNEKLDIEDFHSKILSDQTTLAALTYPIVIGFVSIFLQNSYSTKARLQIYMVVTGARLSGLSSLFLILVMAFQKAFINVVPPNVALHWSFFDLIWFLGNAMATIWFLYETIEFIRAERQRDVVTQYAVNIAWQEELQLLLKYHYLWGAPEYSFLTESLATDSVKIKPTLYLHPLFHNRGEIEVAKQIRYPSVLRDVRLRPLNWVIKRWMLRSQKAAENKPGERKKNSELYIILEPEKVYDGKLVLCRREGGAPLKWYERILIRQCFSFMRDFRRPTWIAVDDIFDDFQGNILQAADQRQINVFRNAIRSFREFLSILIHASKFTDSEGTIDNYTNLEDPRSIFTERIYQNWLQYYNDVFTKSVFLLQENDSYFEISVYAPKHLYADCRDAIPASMQRSIIQLPGSLFDQLGLWWIRRVEEQGTITHEPTCGAELSPPYKNLYEHALRTFVGAWESLSDSFFDHGKDALSWEQLIETLPSFEAHLERTLIMLYKSILRGDVAAAKEMTGVLQNWLGHHRFRLESARYSVQKPLFVSIIDINKKDWEGLSAAFQVQPLIHDRNNAPMGLYGVGLNNYWVDINCLIIYLLILVGKNSSEVNNNLALRTARALILGEMMSLDTEVDKPVKSFQKLIECLIRQFFASDGQYHRKLDNLTEKLQGLREPEQITSRVRTRVGSRGLDSVNDGQIIFLICLANSAWDPGTDSRFINPLLQLSSDNDDTARELQSFLDSLIKHTAEIDCGEWNYIFSFIRSIEPDVTVFEKSKTIVISTMKKIKEIIESAHNKRLIEAEISDDRMSKIAQAASSLAFSKETAALPISFFAEVEKTSLMAEERYLSINDYEKGCLTEPIMAPIAVNEHDWFAKTVNDHVASFVMADVLKQCEIVTVDASTADKYWVHLKQASSMMLKNGHHPILLLENATIPCWVWDWQWPEVEGRYQRPPELIISREQDMNEDYVAHFNKIAVYRGPVPSGASYILPREIFKKLTFTKHENGYEIKPTPEPTKNPIFVNLVLHWAQKVELSPYQVIQLRYDSAGLEDEA